MSTGKPRAHPAVADALVAISRGLAARANILEFAGKVTHVYNPLVYARGAHEQYLRRFGAHRGATLMLGMNPGPWGMAQTGVPFGEVSAVRDWMRIDAAIGRPPREHPKRPVLGLACRRSEVSGARLWGWARERFGTARAFFSRFFVWNYCPLAFMVDSGANFTPDKLPAAERAPLYALCDEALAAVIEAVEPRAVVGIGAFARQRAEAIEAARNVPIGQILHPSPASPAANRGWAPQAERQLYELGLLG